MPPAYCRPRGVASEAVKCCPTSLGCCERWRRRASGAIERTGVQRPPLRGQAALSFCRERPRGLHRPDAPRLPPKAPRSVPRRHRSCRHQALPANLRSGDRPRPGRAPGVLPRPGRPRLRRPSPRRGRPWPSSRRTRWHGWPRARSTTGSTPGRRASGFRSPSMSTPRCWPTRSSRAGPAPRAPTPGPGLPLPGVRGAGRPGASPAPLGAGRADDAREPRAPLSPASPGGPRGGLRGRARARRRAPIPPAGRAARARGAAVARRSRGTGPGSAGPARGARARARRAHDVSGPAGGAARRGLGHRRPASPGQPGHRLASPRGG
jgi:hypothetical protein